MNKIRNSRDFRLGYEILRDTIKLLKEKNVDSDRIMNHVVELKRNIRQYANRNVNSFNIGNGVMCERRIVKDNGIDGFVELISFPEAFDTIDGEDGAEEFFKTFFEIHARPSMYDCTGQAFTSWYKLFERNGRIYAYHCVGFDV